MFHGGAKFCCSTCTQQSLAEVYSPTGSGFAVTLEANMRVENLRVLAAAAASIVALIALGQSG